MKHATEIIDATLLSSVVL